MDYFLKDEPELIAETPSYLVLFKPAGIHTVPLKEGEGGTLLDWCVTRYPETGGLIGKKAVEGGIVHRLDRETRGLVLAARTRRSLDYLYSRQKEGGIVKRYLALAAPVKARPEGFPPEPHVASVIRAALSNAGEPRAGCGPSAFLLSPDSERPLIIESAFRAYGPGRKAVRPAAAGKGALYRTEICSGKTEGGLMCFDVKISLGFRHQIRCHLAWAAFPIVNDSLYGGVSASPPCLGLIAVGLRFADPDTGGIREYNLATYPLS